MAVIADTHSNADALEAVLADIAKRGIDDIVNLGDNANGPAYPERSVDLLRSRAKYNVRGNGDRMTAGVGTISRSAQFARIRLSPERLAWLGDLPSTIQGDGWFACHGTPTSDTEYLLEEVTKDKVSLRSEFDIAVRLGDVHQPLILCGHSHLARVVALEDGRMIVNPGSVGLQAYDEAEPFPHKMEMGSPHARYAVVARNAFTWEAELVRVPYPWSHASQKARASGFEDWVRPLETGRV
jgi:predicted phosphodiesterase